MVKLFILIAFSFYATNHIAKKNICFVFKKCINKKKEFRVKNYIFTTIFNSLLLKKNQFYFYIIK
jgi:hypothetical protein